MIINQTNGVRYKLDYFGGQMMDKSYTRYMHEKDLGKGMVNKSWLIDPHSWFKKLWDLVMLFLTLYAATIVPYSIAFGEDGLDYDYFELAVDVFFILDMIITFFTPYEFFDGTLQYSHKRIA